MLVRYRMSSPVASAEPRMPLSAARDLMRRKRIRQLPVLEKSRLVGIVTDRDLRGAPAGAAVVGDVMTRQPRVIGPDAAVDEAARVLRRYKFNALPVVSKNRVIGILTATDVLTAFVELSGACQPTYRLLVTAADGRGVEARLREAVQRGGGELKWLHRERLERRQLHLRIRARRVGDVSTAIEAAGFEVNSVIASGGPR